MGIMAWIPFDGGEVVVLVDGRGGGGAVAESKKERVSNLILQLGTSTLALCVPLQHGIFLIAISKQLLQSC